MFILIIDIKRVWTGGDRVGGGEKNFLALRAREKKSDFSLVFKEKWTNFEFS